MEKINLPFFYQLGYHLNPLTRVRLEQLERVQFLYSVWTVKGYMESLLNSTLTLTVCRTPGKELLKAIETYNETYQKLSTEELSKPPVYPEFDKIQGVIDKAKAFETVLCAELNTLEAYHVSKKGIYDTTALIARTENVLPISMLNRIDQKVVVEIRESGKCLAFDCATASGFHIMRATELILHKYYIHVCNPESQNRLSNWGAYIEKLKLVGSTEVKEVVAILLQIKDRHRNLIMHPEIVLTPDEAFTLFQIAQGAIIAMVNTLPVPKKK